MAGLRLDGIHKRYGSVQVINGIDLEANDGELVVMVGPSGCGKSTILRLITGLEDPDEGRIIIEGQDVTSVKPSKRGVAMVFQSYALFPHMTVEENIGFGLRLAKLPKAEIRTRVAEAAKVLQIAELLDRKPRHLSGGQRQRVAIGRSIIRNPKVFLFDEPLSNLDAALRVRMRLEIARLHKRLEATMIYVTHDQTEAMTLADRIVVINGGQIEQVGTPMELYEHPANVFVARFIGSPAMNLVEVEERGEGNTSVLVAGSIKVVPTERQLSGAATVGFRPEHVEIATSEETDFSGTVEIVEKLGTESLVHLQTDASDAPFTMRVSPEVRIDTGQTVKLRLNKKKLHFFGQDGSALV